MSVNKTYTVAFSVALVGDQLQLTFPSITKIYYFNRYEIQFTTDSADSASPYVTIADDSSAVKVSWALSTSPVAASAALWIAAVEALLIAVPLGVVQIDTNEPLVVTASVTSAATLLTQDCFPTETTTYRSCSVQIVANASANTITGEGSNDNITWTPIQGAYTISSPSSSFINSATTVTSGLLIFPLSTRYFRVRVSNYIGGTTTVSVCFSKDPPANLQTLATLTTGLGVNVGFVGVQYASNSTGGASRYHVVSANSTNAANIKASVTRLHGWSLSNTNAAYRYVKFHNTTGVPTAGVNVFMTIGIPPNSYVRHSMESGITFATGLGVTMVTGTADSDSAAVGLNDIVGDIYYV